MNIKICSPLECGTEENDNNHRFNPFFKLLPLGDVHKRRPHSGGKWFVQCGHFAIKEITSDADSAFLLQKNFGFFEIYSVPARTRREGGVKASADILRTMGEMVNFSRFCAYVFLWTVPYLAFSKTYRNSTRRCWVVNSLEHCQISTVWDVNFRPPAHEVLVHSLTTRPSGRDKETIRV